MLQSAKLVYLHYLIGSLCQLTEPLEQNTMDWATQTADVPSALDASEIRGPARPGGTEHAQSPL